MEIIKILAKTPLPTLLILIGFVMLSIGFGLSFKVIVNVEGMNKTYAKTTGIIALIAGILFYLSNLFSKGMLEFHPPHDPFLVYYLIGVLTVLILCWAVLMFTPAELQVRAIKYCFILFGSLATIAVIWRGMDNYAYLINPKTQNIPLALYERYNYLPYFALLGTGILILVWIISVCTRGELKIENRVPIYNHFVLFCIYLGTCRLAWEFVDYIARVRLPK